MYIIATDLDRTLLPNGNQEYDDSMHIFVEILKKEKPLLIYVTGRNLNLIKSAMKQYHTPLPDYIIAEVGTKIYETKDNEFEEDINWIKKIENMTENWNITNFRDELSVIKDLRIQEEEKQNRFKLSYYIDNPKNTDIIVKEVTKIIKSACKDASIVYSIDETHNIGLLDILPRHATKLTALEYLRKSLKKDKEDIIYCGDSGNDLLPLTSGYKSIIVKNAIDEVKNTVKNVCFQRNCSDCLYIAKGYKKLNGYYVSGIIEGLIKFGLIPEKYAE